MSEIIVSPSILSADFANLAKEIQAVELAGAQWIHVDVMDGHFVPNLTIGAPVVKSLRKITNKKLDVHLMVEKPENLLQDFIDAGSDVITIHIESTQKVTECLQKIRAAGRIAGITLKPATSIAEIEPYLHLVDLILVMTVNPGFSGQSFMAEQVQKISALKKILAQKRLTPLIEVDGGINEITAGECVRAGATVLVTGNYVFKSKNYADAISSLKKANV